MTPSDSAPWLGANDRLISAHANFGIMGIVNITPDSFYDGGKYFSPRAALERATELLASGADVLDVGAESSRPGAEPLYAAREMERLSPPLRDILALGAPVSVDTWHGATAAFALEQGASIINDISACAWDEELLDVLAQYRPGYVLMHAGARPKLMGNAPAYGNVVDDVLEFLNSGLDMLARAGLPDNRIVIDPGIGFGKSLRHNLELLANIEKFSRFGRPVLAGISMKSMFGGLLGLEPESRGCATAVASALLWQKGVFWHRVHDAASVQDALTTAACLANPDNALQGACGCRH